jgi:hypothetical protein
MSPTASEATGFKVAAYQVNRWLLWRKPDNTWVWALTALPTGQTRLETRVLTRFEWARPLSAMLGVFLLGLVTSR